MVRHSSVVAACLFALGLGGCGSEGSVVEEEDEADLVGVTNLARIEASLGLVRQTATRTVDPTALRKGECHKALIANMPAGSFEARRYQNGASFFAKLGAGANSGHERPVLCVDLHSPKFSISGVALDAVVRYGLGKLVEYEGGMFDRYARFERGEIHTKPVAWRPLPECPETLTACQTPEAERFASVQLRPHEQAQIVPQMTIDGWISSIEVKATNVTSPAGTTSVADAMISGTLATLVYRYAWRKAEDTGVFDIASDAVGKFTGTFELLSEETVLNGRPRFAHAVGMQWGGVDGWGDRSDVALAPTDPVPGAAPLAECKIFEPEEYGEAAGYGPPDYRCTGI